MIYEQIKDGILLYNCNFSLKNTFDCGQCFRFEQIPLNELDGNFSLKKESPIADCWHGVAYERHIVLFQYEDGNVFIKTSVEDFENIWKTYFDLDRNYLELSEKMFINSFRSEERRVGKECVSACRGGLLWCV